MARIGIDCRFASALAGLGTYTRSIVPPLLEYLKDHDCLLIVRSLDEEWLRCTPTSVRVVLDAPHYSFSEQLLLPRRLKELSIDLLYSPHFNVPLFPGVPFVCTVHDLTLHHYPNSAGRIKQLAYRIVMRRAVTRAREVITVSQFTQQDVQKHYGVWSHHVTEGYGPEFTRLSTSTVQAVCSSYGLLGSYFLYVGGSNEQKNLQMLIDAHKASSTDIPLVLVSGGKGLSSLSLHDSVHLLCDVPHYDLPALYNGATCFVTASLYEGFCLPILEARACGTPIIAANTTAIPEVAGEHAVLVSPTVSNISEALSCPPNKADLPDAQYSWEHAASEISSILTDALKKTV
ncbi:glycosyltransferase family 4 protein [Candidatus Peribacteria bacterium]|nr:glycosyltransferase family 4 protein [Candidatus Peribacteria bacterium]